MLATLRRWLFPAKPSATLELARKLMRADPNEDPGQETFTEDQFATYLERQKCLPWLMSYDDDPLIRSLYAEQRVSNLPIRYSLQKKMSANELVICPPALKLPRSCEISGIKASLPRITSNKEP